MFSIFPSILCIVGFFKIHTTIYNIKSRITFMRSKRNFSCKVPKNNISSNSWTSCINVFFDSSLNIANINSA
ncbi:362R [Invertebrate iridescent virus Kaz2018]|uniref:Uncharacterized protein n=1 Tax=Iridovirus sp. TaxID=135728 RepID=A0AAU7YEQ5_9VIRU|nr:362R [Invertebrate iridescent virus Kaz2018]